MWERAAIAGVERSSPRNLQEQEDSSRRSLKKEKKKNFSGHFAWDLRYFKLGIYHILVVIVKLKYYDTLRCSKPG